MKIKISRLQFQLSKRWLPVVGLIMALASCSFQPSPREIEPEATLTFEISQSGSNYVADSLTSSSTYTGTLKFVVESAVAEIGIVDGGKIIFGSGTFNLGADWFEFDFVTDVVFEGQGMNSTTLTNNSSAATDTEIFDCTACDRITVRDMTVAAGGPFRSTSDALDFDGGDNVLVERVRITSSRGRGIVFDGKGSPGSGLGTANYNVVRDCEISTLPSHGIELLASGSNLIENCTITDVAGSGIVINKSSSTATQPNKKSNDNVLRGNTIINAGNDGIRVNSSDRNIIVDNTVLNSSDDVSGRDGIRIFSADGILCNDNIVELNTASDNQSPKTQRYGLKINNSTCNNNVVVNNNDFTGNLTGPIFDVGTGTIYGNTSDTSSPSTPTGLSATGEPERVILNWNASSDNVGVIGYEIYRDSDLLANVANITSYTDTVVDGGISYSYQVRARDAAANWSGLSGAASGTPGSVNVLTFSPDADTYVYASSPTKNYGTSVSLQLDGSPVKHLLFRFNVSGIGSDNIVSARLRLFNTSSSPVGGDFYSVSDNNWNEANPGGVTWNTAPAHQSQFTSLGAVASNNWYEVDLSSLITADGLVSFKVISADPDSAHYRSKEAATNRPQLIIETTP